MDLTGHTLLGKYEIVSLLGMGGMGSVWRARHTQTGRKLAVKVLDQSYLKNRKIVQRFEREARAASTIQHPGIVEVLDIDQTEDGVPFMVMEFLEGETLALRIERRGRLGQDEVLHVGTQLLDALESAHAHGVIHRDLKPENVYVVPAGRQGEIIKILDFGISHMREEGEQKLTMTGSVLGTPHYMSPEQAMGDVDVDHRADLYAMGVVLYECAVGDVPYDAPNYNKLLRLILDQAPPPPRSRGAEISAEVERVIQWAMEKDRRRRISSAVEMRDWLERAAKGECPPYEHEPSKTAPKASAVVSRPAGTLPANRGVASMLSEAGRSATDAWRSPAVTQAEEPESGDGLEWELDIDVEAPSRAPLSSSPPPPARSEPPDSFPLPSAEDAPLELELDERAMRPRSVRPPPAVAGISGSHSAVSASSAGAIIAPLSEPPPTSHVPPRLGPSTGSYEAVDVAPAETPAWRRYALFGVLGVLGFVGLVVAINWIVNPGVDDATIQVQAQPMPEPVERPGVPASEPRWVSVRVVGLPPGARLSLDGLPASTPVRVRRGGAHTIEVTAPGYETRSIEFEADRNRTVHARMRPAEGTVRADP